VVIQQNVILFGGKNIDSYREQWLAQMKGGGMPGLKNGCVEAEAQEGGWSWGNYRGKRTPNVVGWGTDN